jgi:hypothetical protein
VVTNSLRLRGFKPLTDHDAEVAHAPEPEVRELSGARS